MADARGQEAEAFRPAEVAVVPSGRSPYVQAEPAAKTNGFADIANDLQDELARLGRVGISASQVSDALGDVKGRSLGRQLREPWRSMS